LNATAGETAMLDATKTHETKALRHEAQLNCCRFSPCGKYVAAGSYDGTVLRWTLDGDAKVVLGGHGGWVTSLAFSPDAVHLFTVDTWGKLCCWPYADDAPAAKWTVADAHPSWIREVAVSPDGKLVATAGNDCTVRIWQAADGNAVRELDAKPLYTRPSGNIIDAGGVREMSFSRDGKHLACAGITDYGSSVVKGFPAVVLLDWESGQQKHLLRPKNYEKEFQVHGVFVEGLSFHRDGLLIGAGGNGEREGALWFWNADESEPVFEINPVPGSCCLDIHPDGLRLAIAQFQENGRGKNGGNGRKATPEEYRCHHGVVRIYEMAAKEA
jgi:WD40 repeat protein